MPRGYSQEQDKLMDMYDHIYNKVCRQVYQDSIPGGGINFKNKFKEEQEETQNILRKLRQSQEELGTIAESKQVLVSRPEKNGHGKSAMNEHR